MLEPTRPTLWQTTSTAGREMIKQFEGCRLTSYQDGGGLWTIGYGHTGLGVRPKETITQAVAEELFSEDIKRIETGVRRLVGTVSQNQFDALVSFAFNEGLHSLEVSTLLKKFKRGDVEGAAGEFHRWVTVRGDRYEGLVKRRAQERDLFLTPV